MARVNGFVATPARAGRTQGESADPCRNAALEARASSAWPLAHWPSSRMQMPFRPLGSAIG